MPKNVVKLCEVCHERHSFRRSLWKWARKGRYMVCFKWRVGKPQVITLSGLASAIDTVERAFFGVNPERN